MHRTAPPPPAMAACACLIFALGNACARQQATDKSSAEVVSALPENVPDLVDATSSYRLDFQHVGGDPAQFAIPSIMGGGGALLDYDNDGDLDLYLVQSGRSVPGHEASQPTDSGAANRLFRQESNGTLTDVSHESHTGNTGFGMGSAVGDIDNDGDVDLFVSNLGPDALLRNNGDGTFTDISASANVHDPGWSTSAAFFDFDRDGFLDLYVVRYLRYEPSKVCAQENGSRDYCGPAAYAGEHDLLYRNNGDGTFSNHTEAAGLVVARDAGLGLVAADLDRDGWIDVYVANDADPNQLWINSGDGTFVDQAVIHGAAVNQHGASEAGMGVALGDVDDNGHLDLLVSHLIGESNTLYTSLGDTGYHDSSAAAGLLKASLDFTGFGTALLDLSNRGWLDAVVLNGAVKRRSRALTDREDRWRDYAEPNHIFIGAERGTFDPASGGCGDFCRATDVSRSLLPGDIDQDGDLDLVVTSLSDPARIYRNDSAAHNWIEIRLERPELQREAHGALVAAWFGERCRVSAAVPLGGYLAGGHPRIHLGLGTADSIERFEVIWPSGRREAFAGARANQVVDLRESSGVAHPGLEWSQPC